MRNIALIVVSSLVSLTVLAVAVLILGTVRPEPEALTRIFANTDGTACQQMCLFGLSPTNTTASEALHSLENNLVTLHMQKSVISNGRDEPFRVSFSARDAVISVENQGLWISLNLNNQDVDLWHFPTPAWLKKPIHMGDILAHFNASNIKPMITLLNNGNYMLAYTQGDKRMLLTFKPANRSRIGSQDRLMTINLWRTREMPLYRKVWHRWEGFGLTSRYAPKVTTNSLD